MGWIFGTSRVEDRKITPGKSLPKMGSARLPPLTMWKHDVNHGMTSWSSNGGHPVSVNWFLMTPTVSRHSLLDTPYKRKHSWIVCARICDSKNLGNPILKDRHQSTNGDVAIIPIQRSTIAGWMGHMISKLLSNWLAVTTSKWSSILVNELHNIQSSIRLFKGVSINIINGGNGCL